MPRAGARSGKTPGFDSRTHLLRIQPITDVLDRISIERSIQILGHVGHVRRCQHVVQSSEWMTCR
jgi:hypothetical protein